MVTGQEVDFINFVQLVVKKYFYVLVAEEVEVDLVTVVADGHDETALQIEGVDLLCHGQFAKLFFTHRY